MPLFRRRKLPDDVRRRFLILAARAEEAVIDTHVDQLLEILRQLGDDLDVDRLLELYIDTLELPEPLALAVSNRLLARLDVSAAGRRR